MADQARNAEARGATATSRSPWTRVETAMIDTSRGVRQAFDRRFSALGLNLSQALLVAVVTDFGPHTQTQIAEVLSLGRAATGSCIDHLEERGLVRRDPDPEDRRVWVVSATPEGEKMAEEIRTIDQVLQAELRRGITRAERQQLANLLIKIQANLEPILGEPAPK